MGRGTRFTSFTSKAHDDPLARARYNFPRTNNLLLNDWSFRVLQLAYSTHAHSSRQGIGTAVGKVWRV